MEFETSSSGKRCLPHPADIRSSGWIPGARYASLKPIERFDHDFDQKRIGTLKWVQSLMFSLKTLEEADARRVLFMHLLEKFKRTYNRHYYFYILKLIPKDWIAFFCFKCLCKFLASSTNVFKMPWAMYDAEIQSIAGAYFQPFPSLLQ